MSITNHPAVSLGVGDDLGSTVKELFRARFRRSNEKGQALVEFALVLPVLLLVVTGMLAFGIFLNNYLTLTDAVSTGARQLAISRGQATLPSGVVDPCALTVNAIKSAAPFLVPANLTFKFVLNTTTYTGTTCSSASNSTGAAANLVATKPATVTVTYPCTLAVYGINYAPSCTLTAQTTEIVQ